MANHLDPSDPVAARLIRFKAGRLSRRRPFTPTDREDIEQELRLHLLVQAPKFDPSSGNWECWASVILDRRCISLWRERNAEKRTPAREEYSLDEPVLDSDGRVVPRRETTPEAASDPTRRRDLECDLAEVLSRLPDELRSVALALAFATPTSACTEVGISRRAMPKAVDLLREILHDTGLDGYL